MAENSSQNVQNIQNSVADSQNNAVLFDIIIVGAGPAGCSAALHSARAGLKVLVLEDHEVIGEPVHCGECLSQICIDKLDVTPSPESISMRVKGVKVIFPDGSFNILTEDGVVLEKQKFEQWIAREAQKVGATFKLGHRMTEAKRENGLWNITTPKGIFNSKFLIDATGVSSILSAKLNINQRFKTVIGMQYEMEEIPQEGYLDFYIWPELAPHGYLWMIPKSNGRANIGLVTNENNKAKEYLNEFVKRMGYENKKVIKTFGGLIPASGPLANTYADGLLLIGDAAGFTSPLFEGGTHLGIQSGIYASQVAKRAITENNLSKENLKEYETLWKKEFPNYDVLVQGKDCLYSFTDSELNELSHLMPKETNEIPALLKIKIGLKLFITKRHLLKKGAMKTFNSFGYSRAKKYGW